MTVDPPTTPSESAPDTAAPTPVGVEGTARLGLPNRRRLLAGWMPLPLVQQNALSGLSLLSPVDQQRFWQECGMAQLAVTQLATVDLSPAPLLPLQPHEEPWVAAVRATPQFQQAFGGQAHRFARVPIAKLTSFQPFLDRSTSPIPEDPNAIVEWCLPQKFEVMTQITVMAPVPPRGPTVLFTTKDPRATFALLQTPNGAVLTMQPNLNWVHVAITENRCIVRNGYHRIAALAAAGHHDVPAIVTFPPSLDQAVLEGPDWFPAAFLRQHPRPPLVTDFLDARVTAEITLPTFQRITEVRLDVSTLIVNS